jgi:hypothetical protein
MNHTHLTDEQLIATCVDGTASQTVPDGAARCAACQSRLAALATLLDEVKATADATADAAFPPERLARQHSRILGRLVPHRQIARIIAFPHTRHLSTSPRPVRRWVAGAAAAGLIVGMVAGRLTHDLPQGDARASGPPAMRARSAAIPEYTSAGAASDDDFLLEIEQAVSSSPAELRRLDRVTPSAWEQR